MEGGGGKVAFATGSCLGKWLPEKTEILDGLTWQIRITTIKFN